MTESQHHPGPGCHCGQHHPDCYCGQITDPDANPICDVCQHEYAEAVQELYDTDPAFRAEIDRWVPLESPEGQHILSSITEEMPA